MNSRSLIIHVTHFDGPYFVKMAEPVRVHIEMAAASDKMVGGF